ncbi:MAG: hypothetical protein E4G74_04200 [Erysipelotrichales bacterium]|nr:MAG: hypothetical protein E4G74_04200 [Erysipelotrichales bacterium]
MMEKQALIDVFIARVKSEDEIKELFQDVEELESDLREHDVTLDQLQIPLLRNYIAKLIRDERNTMSRFLNLMRYFGTTHQYDLYIYFTSLLNSPGVVDQIKLRLDPEVRNTVFDKLQEPPLGSDIDQMPAYTSRFMERLTQTMERTDLRKALAGNNHELPQEAFAKEKEIFDQSNSLDEYLKGLNQRGIDTLQKHCDLGIIWFEQIITQEVVDYVKTNPEIMSATRVGNKLYIAAHRNKAEVAISDRQIGETIGIDIFFE